MALSDFFKGNVVMGLAVGIGVAVVAPVVIPIVASVVKPLTKGAIKGGLIVYDKSMEVVVEIGEVMEDIFAEAKSELSENIAHAAEAVKNQAGKV